MGRTMAGQGYAGRYASGYARGYGATTGRTVAGQGYAGRYAGGYGRYGYGRYGYGALGAGIGSGPADWGWGYPGYAYSSGYDWSYPGYASTWRAGNCTCGGHFTSGTAGAW
jgi:hypothetical protein